MTNKIRVSCDRKNLKTIRTFVTDTLAPVHLSEITLNQIILAVDEICANLIIHANQEDSQKFLNLTIRYDDKEMVFELSDNGKAFERANYREPNIQDNIRMGKKGGVGVALVNRIMDKVEYSVNGNTNICILHKYIP
ncbi:MULTISPECIES: ATP-binding protein [Rufibacter]|uniref:Serine/threonine-protein kinase RsbW n=1 Tax=Rufibacter quisquiliarum TaxID=1549639 RepID=A0A839GNZ7_9BACT|nr:MULTISPECIES: ATP-binding protein [Rufibacter]MBA9079683.1 serine/threonine-protein kinase RsbW [Rufibacter quisquiliarum]